MFPLFSIPLIIIIILVIGGFVGNGFIVVINCLDWIKSRKISSSDMILIPLSTSRCVLQGTLILYIYSLYFSDIRKLAPLNTACVILWMFVNHASLWFSTCLSVLYCMKIISFTQPLLLRMKQRIYGMVPWLLLGSVLVSSVTSIPLLWTLCNNSVADAHLHSPDLFFFLYIAGSFFPFTISLVSSILLITSLWSHTKKMQQNIASFRDLKADAHINAIKALISFLILYVSSFAAQTVVLLLNRVDNYIWTFEICAIMVAAYPSVHSIILILINSKLKEASVRILQCTMCHLRKETSYTIS
ncbi:taste 2 receptor member 7 [Chelydra serpentina]|uniref:Taste receptor type 2 n=1 Tax=Chelydra serpentina TaxID=8475 RepID=A0A8T1SAI3_CHESE|nr:taste 2 receptor member 7 [Chelydra serpentina]